MKVIQVPFCFYPDSVGGTEIYVEALSYQLQKQGLEILIAAPGEVSQLYQYKDLPIRRFAVTSKINNLREIYGEGDDRASQEFIHILEAEKPDLVHLHAFTSAVSIRLVRIIKQRKIPVVFTYHTPTVSCQRGTFMRWGTQICDGKLDLYTCSRCTLHGLGLNRIGSAWVGSIPPIIGYSIGAINLQGHIWTALRMTELVSLRHAALQTLLLEVDHIVAVCNWVRDILLRNHVPSEKITVSRQGLCQEQPALSHKKKSDKNLKIAFLGRLESIKGIDILIRAFRATPQLTVSLDIYGISQNSTADAYKQELLELANQDSRIAFKSPVPTEQVVNLLTGYDLLAVPSRCLETGPLVVLEAFAAGIPVIGSNLGGIAEFVEHEVTGLLVEPDSVEAWSQELQRLSRDRNLLTRLSSAIPPPKNIKTVAQEMLSLYQGILQK